MAATVVICFTDIVGSTALQQRVGDDAFDTMRRAHFDLLTREVSAQGGELVKNLGDGAMIAFAGASDAVTAAVNIQRAVEAVARRQGADRITIRVGISAGDAVQEGDDWFGAPVVEGARLCSAASDGQILVSQVVRLLAGSRGGHEFRTVGVGRVDMFVGTAQQHQRSLVEHMAGELRRACCCCCTCCGWIARPPC